jgi:indolepyruvate decarboxylase
VTQARVLGLGDTHPSRRHLHVGKPGRFSLPDRILRTVARHLVDRLAEIGISHLFGVPGDYNLTLLDSVISHPDISWVGTANELNAAYAADGYARCRGAGALLTTFGVGELSAINGLAGSFAEFVPVLEIVGSPPMHAQEKQINLHHTLGDGEFSHFMRMHQKVTIARADLRPDNAAAEIDRVLVEMLRHRRPGYIVVPSDVVGAPVDERGPLALAEPICDQRKLAAFAAHARELLSASAYTAVLADFLVDRFGAREEVKGVISAGDLAYATMLPGKGVLDESTANFVGTYVGAASEPRVREVIEGAGALIAAGVLFTDVTTAGFSHDIRRDRLIDLQPFHASVAGRRYDDVPLGSALKALAQLLTSMAPRRPQRCSDRVRPSFVDCLDETKTITQTLLWDRLERFLRSDDVVVADQGTSSFGIGCKRLPAGVAVLTQPLWGSIGYAIPAAFGAGTALPTRRLIVLTGDGSALMTSQEIGTMLRDGLKPIILLLNNDGYTIERAIHGAEQPYNDIPQWDWQLLARSMGGEGRSMSRRVGSLRELDDVLADAEASEVLAVIEIVLGRQDVPDLLSDIVCRVTQRRPEPERT